MDAQSNHRPSGAQAFARLVEIIARLRAPDGCPWDREQTHDSLRRHLIEETFETIDAIERRDDPNLCEELGDLLMQPVLHAQLAAESARFDIVDVLESINDKLVRRHPHVFGDAKAQTSAQVLTNWEQIKREEKARQLSAQPDISPVPASILDEVPRGLPALSLALQISQKAARAGFEWPDVRGVLHKLREEIDELEAALEESPQRVNEELGDLLFTMVNIARWKNLDSEIALRDMTRRFARRFALMEETARERGVELSALSSEEWDELWNAAKAQEKQ